MCMSIFEYLSLHMGACGGQIWESDPIELEIQVVVNQMTLVLGTKLWSSGRLALLSIEPPLNCFF